MAIALAGSTNFNDSSVTASTTYSHETPYGEDRVLVLVVSQRDVSGDKVTSFEYNGTALTLEREETHTNADAVLQLWYLKNPDIGTFDIEAVTVTATITDFTMTAYSFNRVDQTDVFEVTATNETTTSPTVDITTTSADNYLVAAMYTAQSTGSKLSADAPATERHKADVGADVLGASDRLVTTATTYTMSWTDTDDDEETSMLVGALKPGATPDMELFNDDFDDNSLDTTRWDYSPNGSATGTEQNKRYEFTLPSSATSSDYVFLTSDLTYDLTGSHVHLQTIETPNDSTTANAVLYAITDSNNWLRTVLEQGTIYFQRKVGGTQTTTASTSFDPILHKWWRIREASGTIHWDTSPDGEDWTSRASWTNTLTLTDMKIEVEASCYENVTDPGNFHFDNLNSKSAGRYWVGGTGDWSNTSRWSTESGGTSGASVPSATDDVFFDSNSGTGTTTINQAATANNVDAAGFTGTITFTTNDLTVSGGLNFVSGMTVTITDWALISYNSSNTGNLITTGGKTMPGQEFDGSGGWILQDGLTVYDDYDHAIELKQGSLDFNNNDVTAFGGLFSNAGESFVISGSGTKTLNLGSSLIQVNGWEYSGSNLTLTEGTSEIEFETLFDGGGETYYDVDNRGTFTDITVGNFTCHDLDLNYSSTRRTHISDDITVTNDFTATGSATTGLKHFDSTTLGTTRTITVNGTATMTHKHIWDITFAGTAAPISGDRLHDMANNSGITFDTPRTLYWVGNGGTWSETDTGHWSTSSGGASGEEPPLAQDNVIFDANSFSSGSQSVSIGAYQTFHDMDWTGVTNTPELSFPFDDLYSTGSLTFASGMTLDTDSGQALIFWNRTDETFDPAGLTFDCEIEIEAYNGKVTLTGDMTVTDDFRFYEGEFDGGTGNVTFSKGLSAYTGSTLSLGSGTWTFTGTGNILNTANTTVNADTSTIHVTDTSSTSKSLHNIRTFYDLEIDGSATQDVTFGYSFGNTSATTIHDLTIHPPNNVTFEDNETYTITGDFNVVGTSGNVITLDSESSTNFTLSKASGQVESDYLDIRNSNATGGADWYAGSNSTDTGPDNSGWIFTNAPSLGEATIVADANISTVQPVTTTYQFDTSDSGPTDAQAVWSNDANAFDGSTSTFADTTFWNTLDEDYSLIGVGTDTPATGHPIDTVRARLHGYQATDGDTIIAEVKHSSDVLGTASVASTTATWGSYVTLSAPTGGWTWAKLQALQVRFQGQASGGTRYVSGAEIEVTTSNEITQGHTASATIVADAIAEATVSGLFTINGPESMVGSSILDGDGIEVDLGMGNFVADSLLEGTVALLKIGASTPTGSSSITLGAEGIGVEKITPTKTYLYKVYDDDGNFVGVWNDVVSDFRYSQEVNSAGASMEVTLARNSDTLSSTFDVIGDDSDDPIETDSGEQIAAETKTVNQVGAGTTVDLNLNVKVYEFIDGEDDLEGTLVFDGYISRYVSRYGTSENTNVSLFSYGADLDNWVLEYNGDTRIPFYSRDPSDMVMQTMKLFNNDGGKTTYEGPKERAVVLNGSSEYIALPSDVPTDMASETTWSCGGWIRTTATGATGSKTVLGVNTTGGGNVLFISKQTSSNYLSFYEGTWEITGSTTVINDGDWHSFFYVRNGSTGTLYVDNVSQGTHTANHVFATTDDWFIGMELDTVTQSDFWDGEIDNFFVTSDVLTSTERSNFHNSDTLPDNLVVHYDFDDDVGSYIVDKSGNSYDAAPGNTGVGYTNDTHNTYAGGAVTATTNLITNPSIETNDTGYSGMGYALSFNGTSDLVTVTDANELDLLSWSLHARFTYNAHPSANGYIVAKGDTGVDTTGENVSYALYTDTAGLVELYFEESDGTDHIFLTNLTLVPGETYDLIGVYDNDEGDMYLYLNGVEQDSDLTVGTHTPEVNAAPLTIGAAKRPSASASKFSDIDVYQVHVFNKALTAQEAAEVYRGANLPSGCVAEYLFEDGTGTTLTDTSGEGNDGTITGAGWVDNRPIVEISEDFNSYHGSNALRIADSLVTNGYLENHPVSSVPQTSGSTFIDGTATGTGSDPGYGLWRVSNSGSWEVEFDQSDVERPNAMRGELTGTGSFIQIRSEGATTYYDTTNNFPMKPNTDYVFRYKMKTNYTSGDGNDGARASLPIATSGGASSAAIHGTNVKTNSQWTQYEYEFTTPADAAYGHVELRIYGHTGTATLQMEAFWDDIEVIELGARYNGAKYTVSGLTDTNNYVASAHVYQEIGDSDYVGMMIPGQATVGVPTAGEWIRVFLPFTASGTTQDIYFTNNTGNYPFYVDAVMVTEGTTLKDYFDGSTTDDSENTYDWTGTANASTSTRDEITQYQSIEFTDTITSYTFNVNTAFEVIKKGIEMAPAEWFFYVDLATNVLHFKPKPTVVDHKFYLGKHIFTFDLERNIENIVNSVYYSGGDTGGGTNLFKKYEDATSIDNYRRGLSRPKDARVKLTSSADIIADSEIERGKEPRYRSSIKISSHQYPTNTIQLGQLVGFRNFGNFVDTITMQVVRIDRTPDWVILQLDTLLPSVPKRLEDIKRNLSQSDVTDNPDSPTV